MNSYPLKFKTIYKDKIWGGQKVKTFLGKDFSPLSNCGETWELSGVSGNISEISNGNFAGKKLNELIAELKANLVGQRIFDQFGEDFPLLVKFIDAQDDLAVQVHPNDALAEIRHQSFGKSEMWYILQADENATVVSSFKQEVDQASFKAAFDTGTLDEILQKEPAVAGDVFYIPAGRVHSIGRGLLLAEIQQTSDLTYRIHDFNRLDAQGNIRELHIDQALDALDYETSDQSKASYTDQSNARVLLVDSPYFTTNKLWLTKNFQVDYTGLDCFKIYVCLEGSAKIHFENGTELIGLGEVVLVPASIEKYMFETSADLVLLESYIRK